ncbi:FKBP-type peptidyl-prolyl cis-trans isomerase [Candidatus Mesenet endosymbiont of Agriotes lineatus]|uniref:FKBP-type peptidyl-prolyl cis-trans isomerase n=1 Tax=Candidatus Mesenet endosymbiont of Agriotes lineatus TaxID=3077948 RepID=UPI0030CC55FD
MEEFVFKLLKKFVVKKLVPKLLWIGVVITLLITTFSLSVSYFTNKGDVGKAEKKPDKGYEINNLNDGIIQTIAFSLLKPILEARIDYYIEKHGLLDYLKKIRKQKEFKDLVNFYDISYGNGKKALCGSKVSLQVYKLLNYDNILNKEQYLQKFMNLNISSTSERKIGEEKELDLGIIGMKEGGERIILINHNMDNAEDANTSDKKSYYIKLLSVKTESPSSVDNLMIFDDANYTSGMPVMCGDEVEINYSVRKHNGELFTDNQSARFKVGDGKVPLAIELGVLKIQEGGKRTIISPSDLLTTTNDMVIDHIKPDEKNVAIINLSVVQSNDLN